MTAGVDERPIGAAETNRPAARRLRSVGRFLRLIGLHAFSSLTRRIVILNLAALVVLVSGILYLNQFRAGLTDARVASLLTQGEIIAQPIAERAAGDIGPVPIDPQDFLDLEVGESLSSLDRPSSGIEFIINP